MVVVDKDIYFKIKMRLFELDISQTKLAKKIGISKQYLSQIVRGVVESEKYRNIIENELGIEIWNKNKDLILK